VKQLRVAVIGAGRLGGFHAQKLAAMDAVRLTAVVDPEPAARNRVAAACHSEPLADFHPLLDEIDAAVVAAPTGLHFSVGRELLEHGIHVLMEKPLTTTAVQAEELTRIAQRQKLVLQVGHVERFNPALAAALPYLRNPKYVDAQRTSPYTFRSTDVGVVLDLMIHDLDLVLWLVRSPLRRVQALGLSVLGGHEDVAQARLEFQSGCVATLSASRVSHEGVRRMQVWSPQACTSIDFAARTAAIVRPSETLLKRQFHGESLMPQQIEHYRQHLGEELLPRQQLALEAVDALALELQDFVESIRTPRAPRVTGQQACEAIAVAEEILAEIDHHAWDDQPDGLVGPLAMPRGPVIPAPHFSHIPAPLPVQRREAG
jgi:predicted dehydrogenase